MSGPTGLPPIWGSSCICDSVNNMHYNGVPVSDKDRAQGSVTKTSSTSLYKGETDAYKILKEKNTFFRV